MKTLSFICCLLFCTVFAKAQAPSQNACELIIYSELVGDKEQPGVDFESECELSFLVVEVFDQWGRHVFGVDDMGMRWANDSDATQQHNVRWRQSLSDTDTYYFVAKYQFSHDKTTHKQEGVFFLKED